MVPLKENVLSAVRKMSGFCNGCIAAASVTDPYLQRYSVRILSKSVTSKAGFPALFKGPTSLTL